MIIYSKNILSFVQDVKNIIKYILLKEIRLKVLGNRFYYKKHSYPIHLVVYHSKSMLGYFDSSFYELGFNECLMHAKEEDLYQVIRHELAHYLTFIEYGNGLLPHGPEFKACCARFGWGDSVSKASICLETKEAFAIQEKGAIFRKIQKLMALGAASSENEAQAAIIKSQQLLLKHNIEAKYLEDEGEAFFLKRIMKEKKKTAKMCAIGRILETFFVSIVYHRATDGTYLEILGSKMSVEIAEYVASVLHFELENLLSNARKKHPGVVKTSFFLGIAKGYCNKIEMLKNEHSKEMTNALVSIEKKIMEAKSMAYRNLSFTRSSTRYCEKSSAIGEEMGKRLHIHPAINKSSELKLLK
jgi:hypothetical protein